MQTRQYSYHPVTFYFSDSGQKSLLGRKKTEELLQRLANAISYLFWKAPQREIRPARRVAVELGLSFCGKSKIRRLNREFRGKDRPTDVLSFPLSDNLRHSIPKEVEFSCTLALGDIVICREVARSQAKGFNIAIESEVLHLAIHGLLHLCGYDHELSEKEENIMESWEQRLLELGRKSK